MSRGQRAKHFKRQRGAKFGTLKRLRQLRINEDLERPCNHLSDILKYPVKFIQLDVRKPGNIRNLNKNNHISSGQIKVPGLI
jgi:hypothetical protein